MSRSREVAAASFGRRNLIINGAMQVAQRGTQVTGLTSSNYRTCDRFLVAINTLGTWTSEQSTDAPADFKYSHKLTCTTADSSPAVNDYMFINQRIEGQNLAHLNYGSSDAKELTLSFWVKSNKTGTIGQEIQTSTSYERTVDVTINAENTWEYKTVSIPANTLHSIAEDNSTGLTVFWWINAGSTYKGTPTSTWGTNNSGRGGTLTSNIGSAVNDYIAITGVQLEVGSAATAFEHRSYGEELALCQRYLQVLSQTEGSYSYNHLGVRDYTYCLFNHWMNVPMRAAPTLTSTTSLTGLSSGTSPGQVRLFNLSVNGSFTWTAGTGAYSTIRVTTQKISIRFTGSSLSGSYGHNVAADNWLTGYPFWLDAEL